MQKFMCATSWLMGVTAIAVGLFHPPFNRDSILCVVVGCFIIVTAPRWR